MASSSSSSKQNVSFAKMRERYLGLDSSRRVESFIGMFDESIAERFLGILKKKLQESKNSPNLLFQGLAGKGLSVFDTKSSVFEEAYSVIKKALPGVLKVGTSDKHIQLLLEVFSELETTEPSAITTQLVCKILAYSLLPLAIPEKIPFFHEVVSGWDFQERKTTGSGSEGSLSSWIRNLHGFDRSSAMKLFKTIFCLIELVHPAKDDSNFAYPATVSDDAYDLFYKQLVVQVMNKTIDDYSFVIPIQIYIMLGQELSQFVKHQTMYDYLPPLNPKSRPLTPSKLQLLDGTHQLIAFNSYLLRRGDTSDIDMPRLTITLRIPDIMRNVLSAAVDKILDFNNELEGQFTDADILRRCSKIVPEVLLFWYEKEDNFNQVPQKLQEKVVEPILLLMRDSKITTARAKTIMAKMISALLLPHQLHPPGVKTPIVPMDPRTVLFEIFARDASKTDKQNYENMIYNSTILALLIAKPENLGPLGDIIRIQVPQQITENFVKKLRSTLLELNSLMSVALRF